MAEKQQQCMVTIRGTPCRNSAVDGFTYNGIPCCIYHLGGDIDAQLRQCPGCRSLDGIHDFGPTCTLTYEDYEEP